MTAILTGWSDADADADGYRADFFVNGGLVASGATALSGDLFDEGDTIHAEVSPYDGFGLGAPETTAPVVAVNTAPSLSSVTLAPPNPRTDDALVAVPSGWSDPDPADGSGYVFEWTVNGVPAASTTDLLPDTEHARGDVVVVTVTPTDGDETGLAVTDSVTIVNTAPSIALVEIVPSAPTTEDEVTAMVSGWQDPDAADTPGYVYQWYVEGSPVGSNDDALDPSLYVEGQEIEVEVTPDDGTDTGVPVLSAGVDVVNSPPTAPIVSVTPADALDTDDLLCEVEVEASDADGDTPLTYSYQWLVDGWPTAFTTPTLPASETTWFETWQCEVTANDGEDDGDPGNAAVVIGQDCDVDGDGGIAEACGGDDCADDDPGRFASNPEVCNGIDDDCDLEADVGAGCPCPVVPADDLHSYMLCGGASVNSLWLPWAEAQAECEAWGYNLVTIDDAEESELIEVTTSLYGSNEEGYTYNSWGPWIGHGWWLGINDEAVEGSYEWTSGTPVSYTVFTPTWGNSTSVNCAVLKWRHTNSDRHWIRRGCGEIRHFVCENLP